MRSAQKLIGRSLSLCVNDIASGRIRYEDVEKIIAQTCWATEADWVRGLANYERNVWRENPEATRIALRLREEGKIEQPRLQGAEAVSLNGGPIWLDAKTLEPIALSEDHQAAIDAAGGIRPLLDLVDAAHRPPEETTAAAREMAHRAEDFRNRN